jgi:hypothetical protein
MPYIEQPSRKELNPLIDQLIDKIVELGKNDDQELLVPGYLNYCCSRLAAGIMLKRYGGIRYKLINMMCGALHCAAYELYRRLGAAYEDRGIVKDGDVDYYVELIERLKAKK